MVKKVSYSEAMAEIEDIVEKLENEELDVDELSSKVKRVSDLIRFCRERLRSTEGEIEKILKDMEEK